MDGWTKHKDNPIFSPKEGSWDRMIEDFVVVRIGGKYHAFYCGGGSYESLSGIGVAVSDIPFGPFLRHTRDPIIRGGHMRMGSVVRVGKKWKMYFSREKRDVFVAEFNDMAGWVERPEPVAMNLTQPCCNLFGKKFLMLATDMKDRGIVALWSDDGLKFGDMRKILDMKPGWPYACGLSNPSFIVEGRQARIFFEGRPKEFTFYSGEDIGGWRVFEATWDGKGEAKITDTPVLDTVDGEWDEAQIANPHIARFGKRHYLYYGGWGLEQKFSVGVAWRNVC